MKKINLYFFGEPGEYDEYNPAYVCNREYVREVLYLIAYNKPFSISTRDIAEQLEIDEKSLKGIIDNLKLIDAIDIRDDKYKLNFTVFLQKDIPILDKYFINIGKIIGDKIIEKKQLIYDKISQLSSYPNFSKERLLYHIICDSIFDGTAFEFFTEKEIFLHSKQQAGNRDYMIFGYEDSEMVELHSNGLLCSSNNYRSESYIFNSFGDSNGERRDMFRFFRKAIKSLESTVPFNDLNFAYIKLIEARNKEIAERCGELMLKISKRKIEISELSYNEKNLADFLYSLGYVQIDKMNNMVQCKVPIFEKVDNKIINEISEIILSDIFSVVKTTFDDFEKNASDLTAIKNKVNIKEISIELWHQVFGFTNEYLVEQKFVEMPEYKKGEGRYLKSFWISKNR
jgi:hypothetical protein